MIASAKVTDGFAAKLPALAGRTFAFGRGLNVLFGPNGSGKTTLLRIVGAYSGTKAGWSGYVTPQETPVRIIGKDKPPYPQRFSFISPGGCKAKVDWDGTASLFTAAGESDTMPGEIDSSPDGLMNVDDLVGEMMGHPSQGQSRVFRIKKLFEALKKPPDLANLPDNYETVNDIWQEAMKSFTDHVKGLPRTGPATLLLDEPDRSLSIPNQVALWLDVLPAIAERAQVIVATHCEHALAHGAAVIELAGGYVEECRKAVARVQAAQNR